MLVSDSMEGAWLGQVCLVVVQDQFRCISEFHRKDPRGLLVSAGIPSPMDEVQQLTVTTLLIDLGIKDLSDLKLWLTI